MSDAETLLRRIVQSANTFDGVLMRDAKAGVYIETCWMDFTDEEYAFLLTFGAAAVYPEKGEPDDAR